MRRVLFLTIALVLLLSTAGTAFAQTIGDYDQTILGEVWTYNFGGFGRFEPVDIVLYRPPTAMWNPAVQAWQATGWPLPEGPYSGTFWWTTQGLGLPPAGQRNLVWYNDSEERRQTYPAYQTADILGNYFAEFMLPRDEVWYMCGYPYKWRCNILRTGYVEFHSPVWQGDFETGLLWPYYDSLYYDATGDFVGAWQLANQQDTVGPLWAGIYDGAGDLVHQEPYEIMGYYWKVSDLEYDLVDPTDFVFIPVP